MSSTNDNGRPTGYGPPAPSSSPMSSVPSQPLKLLLPFFTQDENYDEKVVRARRLHTVEPIDRTGRALQGQALHSQEDIHRLRLHVWQTVQDRLATHGISLAGLNQRFFSWLLPKSNASVQDWEAFLSNPLLVDTETLKELFVLEQSTADSLPDPDKNHLVYIRTFAFTVEGLLEVLQTLLDDGIPEDKIMSLIESVHGLPDNQIVYIRYAGQTTNGSAYTRHYKDLIQRHPTFMTLFLQAVLRVAPEVIDAAEVHEIADATIINFAFFNKDLASKREQALIALLDKTLSINIQVGGSWASSRYITTDKDINDFNALGTSLIQEMSSKCTPCSDELLNQIDSYTARVQAYTIDNLETTGSATFPITERVRMMLRDQAIPTMLGNGEYSLMVTIGSDLTPNAASDAQSFYGGSVGSGNLCASWFNQLGNWDCGQYTKIKSITAQLQEAHYLPFVDLYPWTQKTDSDFPFALSNLRSYLQITKPIVLLTLSQKVSSAAVGSFQHPHGIKKGEFGNAVGKLIISKYDEDPGSRDDNNCVIVIPCYHPGVVVGHISRSSETYMRIIRQVLIIVWLAMDRAAKLSGRWLSKKEICDRVCSEVEDIAGPSTAFGVTLAKLKQTLKAEQATRLRKGSVRDHITFTTRYQALHEGRQASAKPGFSFTYEDGTTSLTSSRNRWTAAKEELYQIMTCEIASPRAQRKQQIIRLDGMALPLLNHKEYEFSKLAKTIAEGRSYYLEVSDRDQRLEDMSNLMSIHLHNEHDPNSSAWKTNAVAVKQADDNLQSWLKSAIFSPGTSSEAAVEKCMFALTKLLQTKDEALAKRLRMETQATVVPKPSGDVLQGSQVHIKPTRASRTNCVLELEWESNGTKHKLEKFYLPGGVLPIDSNDKRYLFFVAGGIDIRDSQNRTLGLSSNRTNTVSLTTIHMILRNEASQEPFLALWEKETGLTVDDQLYGSHQSHALSGSTQVYPATYFRTSGKAWDTSRIAKSRLAAHLRASKPIQPEDAVWLFHKFLLQHYPNVGDIVDAGNPAKWPSPESDTVWPKLQTFLSDQKYRNHPQRANLTSVAQNATDLQQHRRAVATLETVLTLLRTSVKVDSYRTSKGGPERTKKLFTIQGVAPADLLDPDRPEPALVSYSAAQIVDDQGLVPMNDDEEDDEQPDDIQVGPSTSRQAQVETTSDDDEMLLKPEVETRLPPIVAGAARTPIPAFPTHSMTTHTDDQPLQSSEVSRVSESTVGGKRARNSPGERSEKGKRTRMDNNGGSDEDEEFEG